MCRIASSITSLSTKRTDRRSSENQLTVRRHSSRASTFSSPIAFRDAVNRQFLSVDTSPPCESREMTDLRWEDDSGDDDKFLEWLPEHAFGVELLEVASLLLFQTDDIFPTADEGRTTNTSWNDKIYDSN
ncbi:hypothetical protein LR48_Vigan406s024600 [Vigna angularis]|uniref:Uncharacterized protein n=1 Tax=Phaseolus angularis TaxID=3914 RepID=A0A0L9TAK0_PHAAN|nr:hypothetical protein LR48_Vigan406s024600 [Vigna angularis]